MAEQRETITFRYIFNDVERNENSRMLAERQVHKVELEDEKKAVTSEYKAKIDAEQSQINLLSRHVIDGYTMKTVMAIKRKNFALRVWEFVHPDTGEVVKTEPLTGKDLQFDVPLTPREQPGGAKINEQDGTIEGEDLQNGDDGFEEKTEYHPAVPVEVGAAQQPKLLGPADPQSSDEQETEGDGSGDDLRPTEPTNEGKDEPTTKRGPGRPKKS